jgi:hypothetical protein
MIIAASVLIRAFLRPPAPPPGPAYRKSPARGKTPRADYAMALRLRTPTKRMPRSPRPIAESPKRRQIDAITVSMSFCGDRVEDAARCAGPPVSSCGF